MGNAMEFLNKQQRKKISQKRRNKIKELDNEISWRDKEYFTVEEASNYSNISIGTLAKMRIAEGNKTAVDAFIPFIKINKNILYRKTDIDDFLLSRLVTKV